MQIDFSHHPFLQGLEKFEPTEYDKQLLAILEQNSKLAEFLNKYFRFKNRTINENCQTDKAKAVYKFEPLESIVIRIPSINLETASISKNRITEFSIHIGLKLFRVSVYEDSEQTKPVDTFYASADHSLIVYDSQADKIIKISPLDILRTPERYFVLRLNENKQHEQTLSRAELILKEASPLINQLLEQNIRLYQCSQFVKIEPVDKPNYAFDFTVENDYTFALKSGIFVQDTMTLYMPITKEGQRSAYQRMFRQYLHPASGTNALSPNQDSILGNYMLTLKINDTQQPISVNPNITFDEAYKLLEEKKDAYIPVVYKTPSGKTIKTSLGRLAYNLVYYKHGAKEALKDDEYFYNDVVRKKTLKKHLDNVVLYQQEPSKIGELWNDLIKLAQLGEALYPVSIGPEELEVPEEIINEYKKVVEDPNSTPQDILDAISRVMEKIKQWLKSIDSGFYYLIDSGARGSWSDIEQLLVTKGFVVDPQGRIISEVIKHGYVEGLTPKEFFNAAPAWVKGSMDRSVNTAEPGYITRQLIMALATSVITGSDCGTNKYLEVEITDDNYKAFLWRYTNNNELITPANVKQFIGKKVKLRTPIFCKQKDGICAKCYGEFYRLAKTKEVGILAAQSLGERGTQLIMKTFHTGGKAEKFEVPQVIDRENPAVKQVGDYIIAKELPITAVFDVIDSEFTYEEDTIFIKGGAVYIFRGEYYNEEELPSEPDFIIKVDGLTFGVELIVENSEQVNITEYNFFNVIKNSKQFIKLVMVSPDISNMLKLIKQLLAGKLTKTWEELQEMLWKYYTFNFSQLSVHSELVTAAMCRYKDDPTKPMRLFPDKPYIIVHIKDIPYLESPLLGIAFENMTKAILYATLRGYYEYEARSTLEKLLEGSFEKSVGVKEMLEKLEAL